MSAMSARKIKMDILELINADGVTLKKQATTNGGEYAGPCLWRGGNDRFRVWPESGPYWCRQCNKTGDEIQYLIDRRGLSFKEACLFLGRDTGPPKDKPVPTMWQPKESKEPGELWQSKAKTFLDNAIQALWTPYGNKTRAWLKTNKGLNDATIKKALLGYNPADIYETREAWGVDSALNDDGMEKRLWIPAGLIIPLIKNNKIMRLRIRRADPGDGPRYVIISGSRNAPLIIGEDRGAFVIVESELDALLLLQEAGDLVSIVAMGTATAKPDIESHKILKAAPVILISLDTDNAGTKAS
jgi:DNA primase